MTSACTVRILCVLGLMACEGADLPVTTAPLAEQVAETPMAAAPGLTVPDWQRGTTVRVLVQGLTPGLPVTLVQGAGVGEGPCVEAFGGRCLDVVGPVAVVGTGVVAPDGTARVDVRVPSAEPLGPIALQAVAQETGRYTLLEPTATYVRPAPCEGAPEAETQALGLPSEDGVVAEGRVCDARDAWWSVVVPAGEGVAAWIVSSWADGDVDAELWAGDGEALLAWDWSDTGEDELTWLNRSAEDTTVSVRVLQWRDHDAAAGVAYRLDVQRYTAQTCAEDAGLFVGPGSWAELGLCEEGAVDWVEVPLLAGETLEATADFDVAEGDIDLYVHAARDSGWPADPTRHDLAHAWSRTDGEQVRFTAEVDGVYGVAVVLDRDDGEAHVAGTTYGLSLSVLP